MAQRGCRLKSGFMSFLPRAAMLVPAAFLHDGPARLFPSPGSLKAGKLSAHSLKPHCYSMSFIVGRNEDPHTHKHISLPHCRLPKCLCVWLIQCCFFPPVSVIFLYSIHFQTSCNSYHVLPCKGGILWENIERTELHSSSTTNSDVLGSPHR